MTSTTSRSVFALFVVATAVACGRKATVGSPSPATSSTAPAAPFTPQMVAEGDSLYAANACQRCHGPKGAGGQRGPNLTDATWAQIDGSFNSIVKIIQTGVPLASVKGGYQNNMRPLGGTSFTEVQVKSVAAYIYSLSHK